MSVEHRWQGAAFDGLRLTKNGVTLSVSKRDAGGDIGPLAIPTLRKQL